MNFIDIVTIVALFVNTIALIVVIYQTMLTKQSIDSAKTQRQLEALPEVRFIIQTQVELELWKKDLQRRRNLLKEGIDENNNEKIRRASDTKITQPKDLNLNKEMYKNAPIWLRELWMSGAQYYYDAIVPLTTAPDYHFSQNWIDGPCENSLKGISELLIYLGNTIPPVILDTPASLSDADFFRDES